MENSTKHLKTFTIDRFEGAYAILEDNFGRTYDVLKEELPQDSHEGDILNEIEGAYVVNEEATQAKREELRKISERLTKEY